jgi:hypothetical protein
MTAADIVLALNAEMRGVEFGEVTVKIQVRDGQARRAEISRTRSLMLETDANSSEGAANKDPGLHEAPEMRRGAR